MSLKWGNRVKETAPAPNSGNVALAAAAQGGYVRFSSLCANGDTVYYTMIDNLGGWETGLGTWGTGNILSRTTVYSSSNSNNTVNFTNPVTVWVDNPAQGMAQINTSNQLVGSNGVGVSAALMTNIPVANATGVLPAANGGAGSTNGIMKANGSGVVSAAVAGTDFAPPNIVSSSGPSGTGLVGQAWFVI